MSLFSPVKKNAEKIHSLKQEKNAALFIHGIESMHF